MQLSFLDPDTGDQRYVVIADSRGQVDEAIARIRRTAAPARVAFHGPVLEAGKFRADGYSREMAE